MHHFLVTLVELYIYREGGTESRQFFLLPFGTPTTTVAETPHPVVAIISPTPTMVTKMHRNQTPTNCAVARPVAYTTIIKLVPVFFYVFLPVA